jgi:hypothetical protein
MAGSMNPDPPIPHSPARHDAAVRRSLGLADRAAARDDLADAISWIVMVEAVDGWIPDEYARKRETWTERLSETRIARTASQEIGRSR